MARVGKLNVTSINHTTLGHILNVVVPVECTDLINLEDTNLENVDSVVVRLTHETAEKLAKAIKAALAKHEEAVKESFCGAI